MTWYIPKSHEEAVQLVKGTFSPQDIEVLKDVWWWLAGYVAGSADSKPGRHDVEILEKAIQALNGVLKSGGGIELKEE